MKLTETQIEDALRGSVYGNCTRGVWEWNEGSDYKAPSHCITMSHYTAKDEQVICTALSPDIGPSKKWCSNAPVLRDAKLNAARAIILEGLVKELVAEMKGLKTAFSMGAMSAGMTSSLCGVYLGEVTAALHQAKLIMGEE